MKRTALLLTVFLLTISLTGCTKDDEECCTCKDCPECDVCCSCDNPYLNNSN